MSDLKLLPSDQGFLGLGSKDAVDYAAAGAVVIPFGLEHGVSYGGGTAKGPQAILNASHQVELFDEAFRCEPFRQIGIVTLREEQPHKDTQKALRQLENIVEQVMSDGKFPLVLGGEHTVTAAAVCPAAKRHDPLTILHFDAHADLRDSYADNPWSHATAMRRCLDLPSVEVISVGIRNIAAEEYAFLQANKNRVAVHWAQDHGADTLRLLTRQLTGKTVYLTFDIDGLDSGIMPATGTPEPGGLSWREVMQVLDIVNKHAVVVGADINEFAPIPGLHACDFTAAKLTYKILAAALARPQVAAEA